MKPERPFVAERRAALHCAELLATRREQPDPLPLLGAIAGKLARGLADALCPLFAERLDVRARTPEQVDEAGLARSIGALAGNSMIAVGGLGEFLVSVEAAAILRLVDRAFGGPGNVPHELPESFSLSAELVAGRLEAVLLAQAASAMGFADSAMLRAARRHSSLTQLAPFAADTALGRIVLDVSRSDGAAWTITMAFPLDLLARLGGPDMPSASPADPANRPGPHDQPFASIPLPLRAVLVDMRLPLAAVSALKPGDVLPVAVARSVPLLAGQTPLARGTVGEVDDRVALKITQPTRI